MSEWFRYLPWWAKVYWLTAAGDAPIQLPWPRRVRRAGAEAWVSAYIAWKTDGYPAEPR